MLFFRALREFVFAPASSPSLVLDGFAKPLLCLAGLVGSCAIQIRVVQPPQAVAQSRFFLSLPAYVVVAEMDGHRVLRLVVWAIFYTCWIVHLRIESRYMHETIGGPTSKWYFPWTLAKFSIPRNALVH